MEWFAFEQAYQDRFPTAMRERKHMALSYQLACQRYGFESPPPAVALCEMVHDQLQWAQRWKNSTQKLLARIQSKLKQKNGSIQVENALANMSSRREWELSLYALSTTQECDPVAFYLAGCIARHLHWFAPGAWDWEFWKQEIENLLRVIN